MNVEFEIPQESEEKVKHSEEDGEVVTTINIYSTKKLALLNYIKKDIKSADLKWSLFCAACNSYRFDSVLRPFPPFFISEKDEKEIERLRAVIELCKSIVHLMKLLIQDTVPDDLLELLYWVLIERNEISFSFIPKNEHPDIMSRVSSVMPATMPDFIFSVSYDTNKQQNFALTASNKKTRFAFHGSRLDNFYSIVNYGLQVSYNKVSAFGPGIYLSSEIGVSLPYSPRGYTWAFSSLGSHISIVALCEIIDHPDVRSENNSRKNFNRNIFDLCDRQSVPGKYFIVQNNDLVSIRHLLIYSSDEFKSISNVESRSVLGWIKRHKTFTFVAAYVILLLGIGTSNSSFFNKSFRRLMRKFRDFGF